MPNVTFEMSMKLLIGCVEVKFQNLQTKSMGLSVISDKLLTNSKSAPHKKPNDSLRDNISRVLDMNSHTELKFSTFESFNSRDFPLKVV